jgi:hypothetical protein
MRPLPFNALSAYAKKPPFPDACCTPAAEAPASALEPARRSRLADLDPNVHCSIVGTCLTTAELRRVVPRYAKHLDRQRATDLEIHHTAVAMSTEGGEVAKELNKALNDRHALAIRRFKAAGSDEELAKLWSEAMASGDVPGAYWALMTHPAGSATLRTRAFGDVHMLSHLVGASNRADIRRLQALEQECTELREQNGHQQARLQDMGARHAQSVERLTQQAIELTTAKAAQIAPASDMLRAALEECERKLAVADARRDEADRNGHAKSEAITALRAELQLAQSTAAIARAEANALEKALENALARDADRPALPSLKDQCIVYVGGRPATASVLEQMVAQAGGELLIHDGGIEDRKSMLATLLPRAQLVVFPVDYVGHNAMQVTRQQCARHGIPCHPLRSASVASFVELMQRLARA